MAEAFTGVTGTDVFDGQGEVRIAELRRAKNVMSVSEQGRPNAESIKNNYVVTEW